MANPDRQQLSRHAIEALLIARSAARRRPRRARRNGSPMPLDLALAATLLAAAMLFLTLRILGAG